jgi:hypothetical protein
MACVCDALKVLRAMSKYSKSVQRESQFGSNPDILLLEASKCFKYVYASIESASVPCNAIQLVKCSNLDQLSISVGHNPESGDLNSKDTKSV